MMRIFGFKVDDLVREEIRSAALLVADITYPNPNVFYEIGFAIALKKPVLPTVNTSVEKATQRIQRTGIFDTIGWVSYVNADELHDKLHDWTGNSWVDNYIKRKNHSQPLFILDTLVKTDFRNHIFHAVENSGVLYRSYDPAEVPRLTAANAISDVSSAAGVILPLLGAEITDNQGHNLRASFLLGLCHGLEVEALTIQYENSPAPLDYRDFITNSTFKHETEKHVGRFAGQVLIWNQKSFKADPRTATSVLSNIDLGSPTAENEIQKLGSYFVKTAEFSRALRAEGAVITGRKGSGKSALYFQISEVYSRDKRRIVIDIRPASHNLSELREAILDVVSEGVFDHTIASFWQYIIYVEILLKYREVALPKSLNDFSLQERIRNVESSFSLSDSVVSGDFTSRLESAVRMIISAIETVASADDMRKHITNLMFERPIPNLRDAITSFSEFGSEVVLLIDDLDKGWPPRQVEPHDIGMMKHLIEVLNRIKRDLGRRGVDFKHLVFLRSDIYERLVEQTSDRGKYNVIRVDWSDTAQLKYMLTQRILSNLEKDQYETALNAIDGTGGKGGSSIDKMIEGSLRRPRFLIDLCERTLSFAINRGHVIVSNDDVEEGLRQMSLYLVSDFAYEMRDVAGIPQNLFYSFIGLPELLAFEELSAVIKGENVGLNPDELVELLLWYGFLGIVGRDNLSVFIYDFAYDFRRLEAERNSLKDGVLYVVNPAFLKGLSRDAGAPRPSLP